MNREDWLTASITELRAVFTGAGYTVPSNVRVTCGWPSKSAVSAKHRRIGECWADAASEGNVFEVFISPAIADSARVLDILAHELVHATVGLAAGHGKLFKRCMSAIGLEGKATSTTAGAELSARLNAIIDRIGQYPHDTLNALTNNAKKQGTRLLKVECACCGYTARVTAKWGIEMKQRKQGNEIFARIGNNKSVHYVEFVPGDGGVDWGYTTDARKALPLNKYFARRFSADCKKVGAIFFRSYA